MCICRSVLCFCLLNVLKQMGGQSRKICFVALCYSMQVLYLLETYNTIILALATLSRNRIQQFIGIIPFTFLILFFKRLHAVQCSSRTNYRVYQEEINLLERSSESVFMQYHKIEPCFFANVFLISDCVGIHIFFIIFQL